MIAIRATQEAVEVEIEDRAPPFDPLSLADPEIDSDLDTRRIGGLGIYRSRQMADEVAYRYAEGRNILTLVKKRSP